MAAAAVTPAGTWDAALWVMMACRTAGLAVGLLITRLEAADRATRTPIPRRL